MKNRKVFKYSLCAIIMMLIMTVRVNAIELTTTETPSEIESEQEFQIVLKFDEKIKGINAHLLYDDELITIEGAITSDLTVNPTYAKGDCAFIYSVVEPTEDTIKIKAKAKTVNADKVASFITTDMQVVPESNRATNIGDKEFTVTVKSKVNETPQENPQDGSNGESKTEEKKSSEKEDKTTEKTQITTNDSKNTPSKAAAPTKLAKTGESEIIFGILLIAVSFAIITGRKVIKFRKY